MKSEMASVRKKTDHDFTLRLCKRSCTQMTKIWFPSSIGQATKEYTWTRFLVCSFDRIRHFLWYFRHHNLHQENLWCRFRIERYTLWLCLCQSVCTHFRTHMSCWLQSKRSDDCSHRPDILCNLKGNWRSLRVSHTSCQGNQIHFRTDRIVLCFPKRTDTRKECM